MELILGVSQKREDELKSFLIELETVIRKTLKTSCDGILLEMARYQMEGKGKLIRPRILFSLAEALKIPKQMVMPWAAACEFLHNATLVHDDFQDGDKIRRGTPSIWYKYGINHAINLGDMLLVLALKPVMGSDLPTLVKLRLSELYVEMSTKLVKGQTKGFLINLSIDHSCLRELYFECISLKTASLFSDMARGMGLIKGLSEETLIELQRPFKAIGNLFQIQDDILDIFGHKDRDTIGCDIKEGKVSFLILKHLERYQEDLPVIREILLKEREETTLEEIYFLRDLFLEKKTLEVSLKEFNEMIVELKSLKMDCFPSDLSILIGDLLAIISGPLNHLWPNKK